ncbi:ribosomal protein L34-domain-containing protein [Lophiotrema nucula]|uniref:Large ribosomal subunit protein bL34m n=1 Tax=Lophiotrema nucula TaxID=690887 RepID=A0A6A5YZ33_9PLEO|nr:ribosomal protein L34-domain-containing protein [Lophiotrema nucula]
MSAFGCLRTLAMRPGTNATTLLRPVTFRISSLQSARGISILSPRRPVLPSSTSSTPTLAVPGAISPSTATTSLSSETPDLLSRISSHPGLAGIQIRCGPRDTFNPSHFVRKRRHGWLSRIRTKKGRKTLMRRIKKGRWNLSH